MTTNDSSETVPKRVLKFFGSTEYALGTIGHKRITLVHNSKLNDPFDPVPGYFTEFSDDLEMLERWVKENHPDKLERFLLAIPEESFKKLFEEISEIMDEVREMTFVFSTCAVEDDRQNDPKSKLYMWAHYAAGHRGIALEFDTEAVRKSVIEHQKKMGAEQPQDEMWIRMLYREKIPVLSCEAYFNFVWRAATGASSSQEELDQADPLVKFHNEIFRTKSVNWKDEDECRLMWHDSDTALKTSEIPLLPGSITSVYLGLRCPDQTKRDVVRETRKNFPDCRIFEAKRVPGRFELEFAPIDE